MKLYSFSLAFIIFFMTLLMQDIQPYRINAVAESDGLYKSWPTIVHLQNGDLMTIYGKGKGHGTNDYTRAVVSKRSTDEGKTWGEETVIYKDEFDDSIFSADVTSKGTIVLIVRRGVENYDGIKDHGVIRSSDNGKTWSQFVSITSFPRIPVTVSPIVEIPGKGLMAGWHDAKSSNIVWSYDDGATWTNSKELVVSDDVSQIPMEVRFTYLGDGKVLGIGRTQTDGRGLFQLQSSDNGDTWTIKETNVTDQMWTPSALTTYDGFVDIVYYHRGKGIMRERTAKISDIWDKPTQWPNSKVVGYGSPAIGDAGYPMAVQVKDNLFYCVYYSGATDWVASKTSIMGFHYMYGKVSSTI